MHKDIVAFLRQSDTNKFFESQGAEPVVDTTSASFSKLMEIEYSRYSKLVHNLGLKPKR